MRPALILPLLVAACATTPQAAKLSLAQATQVCTERAVEFGQKPWSHVDAEPPNSAVQDRYRACVYANSGSYPAEDVNWRRPPPTPAKEAI